VKSRTLRDGAPWLKTVLVQSAWAASRHKDGYLRAQFLRIKSRRGPKKAIIAVAASILTAAYYLVRDPSPTGNSVHSTFCAWITNGQRPGSLHVCEISGTKSRSEK
jgi:hypothetical protein